MERSPLVTLAVVGFVAVFILAGMYLFSLNQIADTTTAQTAEEIEESLSRSFVPGAKPRVTMLREGKGLEAPRRYVVRYQPTEAVAADPKAIDRLGLRIAEIVVSRLERVRAPVTVHCVAELPGGGDAQRAWRRVGGEESGELAAVDPVPPLPRGAGAPASAGPDQPSGGDEEP